MDNLSRSTLEHLGRHGLEYSVNKLHQKREESEAKAPEPICFPWLVVEHKKSHDDGEECYVEAANAGTAAVMLFKNLARFAKKKAGRQNIRPVETILTTVGQTVRAWIVYSSSKLKGFVSCQWRHSAPRNFVLLLGTVIDNSRRM